MLVYELVKNRMQTYRQRAAFLFFFVLFFSFVEFNANIFCNYAQRNRYEFCSLIIIGSDASRFCFAVQQG